MTVKPKTDIYDAHFDRYFTDLRQRNDSYAPKIRARKCRFTQIETSYTLTCVLGRTETMEIKYIVTNSPTLFYNYKAHSAYFFMGNFKVRLVLVGT